MFQCKTKQKLKIYLYKSSSCSFYVPSATHLKKPDFNDIYMLTSLINIKHVTDRKGCKINSAIMD